MKKIQIASILLLAANLFAADQPKRLFIPFLDPESQSNVAVTVCALYEKGEPCPPEYANALSNTNLFTPEEQRTINDILVKYKSVTTNCGPPGTILVNFYTTNFVAPRLYWVETNAYWLAHRTNEISVSDFQYTNSDGNEEIRFAAGISVTFRNKNADGYNASIARTGSGSLLTFTEKKHGSATSILARFDDMHPQGMTWDYHQADFSNWRLGEYMQTTNGMVLGKWLMWNVENGNLTLAAEAKEPYDWNNHRVSLPQ